MGARCTAGTANLPAVSVWKAAEGPPAPLCVLCNHLARGSPLPLCVPWPLRLQLDVRSPQQMRAQGSPNLGAFRGGKVGVFNVPFFEEADGLTPSPLFASRVAQMKDIYSKTRIYLIDG